MSAIRWTGEEIWALLADHPMRRAQLLALERGLALTRAAPLSSTRRPVLQLPDCR